MIALIVIVVIVVLLVVYLISMYNGLVVKKERVTNAMSQIATQMESRWDALKSMIEATKKYSEHESETLKNVTSSRATLGRNSTVGDIEADQKAFAGALSSLIAVSERYPDLKADGIYLKTMDSIEKFEDLVRRSRMVFNDTVTLYNKTIKTVPTVIFASMFGFSEEEYFKSSEGKTDMPSWN